MARKLLGFLIMILALLIPKAAAFAFDSATACYLVQPEDSPARTAVVIRPSPQLWCYEHLAEPGGATFLFNADGEEVMPELAALIEADGVITHGSLLAGEITLHRVIGAEFNPFSVPLTEPSGAVSTLSAPPERLRDSAQEVLKRFRSEAARLQSLSITEGDVSESVSASALPWRGYWWSYKSRSLLGPLGKYDRFVSAKTGSSPNARGWESANHRYRGISWEGHCNGWAASAIIRAEPRFSRRDPESGVVFSLVDQKGLLAETDYCVVTAFFGKRYRGGGNIRDISPALFHKTLLYYIGQLGKPVAMDYKRDSPVDNHIVSGYRMSIRQTGANLYRVSATLKVHRYDTSRSSSPGTAPTYTRQYRYTLRTDDGGSVIGGTWHSTNPDFLWVPLAPGECSSNNPRVRGSYTNMILRLPSVN
ncbi:MAG: hypothetical protein NDI61_07975 [Bdellovibrionaceae bacterium]|nr:hypothetical protein [Pseudobdellovibrionaceae bacterium]